MTIIRNFIVLVLFSAAIIYGGIKTYLYFQIKDRVEQLVMVTSPFVDIRYKGISTTLDGAFYLEKISLRLKGINDVIKVKQLGFVTPGLDFLLFGANDLIGQGKFPEKLGVSAKGVRIKLTGSLVDSFLAFAPKVPVQEAEVACRFGSSSQIARFIELGMFELVIDSTINMTYNAVQSSMRFNTYSAVKGVEEVNIEFTVENMTGDVYPGGVNQSSRPISSIKINYRPDVAFVKKANQYCAELKQISVEQFIDQLVNQSDERYLEEIGIIPGPGIRSALTTIMKEGGELSIVAQPSVPIDTSKLALYQLKDIPQILGLSVAVNEKPIKDLSFNLGGSSDAKVSDILTYWEQNKQGVEKNIVKQQADLTENKQNYLSVKPSQLINKIGFIARIRTKGGILRTGQVVEVKEKNVTLMKRMFGGHISFKIPLADIASSEIKS